MSTTLRQQTITAVAEVSTAALIEACGLPEIGTVLSGRSLRVADTGPGPFAISGSSIVISAEVSTDLWTAASILREALELLTLGNSTPPRWAHRIVAHATASIYGETVLANQPRSDAAPNLIVEGCLTRLTSRESAEVVAADIAAFIAQRDGLEPSPAGEIRAAGRAMPLAFPTEVLLTLGGDHRQVIDWHSGVNSYGLSPRPVPWRSQFGSCTASAPSPRAFEAARALRHDLIEAAYDDLLDDASDSVADAIREGIRSAFALDKSVEVVLTPSGTDAEFVALALASWVGGPVQGVVLAPDEIGSGSLNAASGRHFSVRSPFSMNLVPGEFVDGFDTLIRGVSTVAVRDDQGQLRPAAEVEAEMREVLESQKGPLLVHAVEGTKTGIRLPRTETLTRWQADFGNRMVVVVDAAQVRVDQSTVTEHVDAGRMVIVTGSKFFGGPPFSGAVLVPGDIVERVGTHQAVGLAPYLSRHDVPQRLASLRSSASPIPNFALLLRWAAALAEITSFMNASPEIRDEILRRLVVGIRQILDSAAHIRIVESPYTMIPSEDHRGLDDLPTIFSFLVLDESGRPLGMEEAKRVHLLLATDLTHEIDSQDQGSRQLLRQAFHLGQPVAINQGNGDVAGALRVAIGAPTLSQILFDVSRGENWRERLELELADIHGAIDKVALIARSEVTHSSQSA